ncbi:MAG: hypothetical protein NXI00_10925 [Cytophagales bacterium]|nr:hypothetical protein [Cytophagales bacterium]
MNRFSENGKPIPFSIIFLTADRANGTGGQWVKADYAVKNSNLKRNSAYQTSEATPKLTENALAKDPNHWKNQTTNIALFAKDEITGKLIKTGQIIKVHYRLIFFIDGKKVE